MEWWWFVLLFVGAMAARLAANHWLARRWINDGMSPTHAAALSMAITYVPVFGLFLVGGWITGRTIPLTAWGLILLAMALPLAMGFGMRRAVFDYMDRYGVKRETKRRQK